jgi:hypothetical protein
VAAQYRLHVGAPAAADRLDLCQGVPVPRDDVAAAGVLDLVEQVGEPAGSLGRGHVRHEIRSSDSWAPTGVAMQQPWRLQPWRVDARWWARSAPSAR